LFRLVLESHDGRAPGADSEEKHEPVSDIETVVVDSLKALDPEWPIREADVRADVPVGRVRANRDRTHCSRLYSIFDRLVGAAEHCRRLMCATSIDLIHAPLWVPKTSSV
jgi:hypothetical protein